MKGHIVAVPKTTYAASMFGVVKRVYYKKIGIMYDIKWDHIDKVVPYSEYQIKMNVDYQKWEFLDNEKELLKFKLKMG